MWFVGWFIGDPLVSCFLGRLVDWLVGGSVCRLIIYSAYDLLAVRLFVLLVSWFVVWLFGWLFGCMLCKLVG